MTAYTRNQEVYILTVPSGHVKVGVSDNIERRIKEIQAYCYEPVSFWGGTLRSDASPVDARQMEWLLHYKLRRFQGERREWFSIDMDTLIGIWRATYRFLAIPPGHEDLSVTCPEQAARRIDIMRRERAMLKARYLP